MGPEVKISAQTTSFHFLQTTSINEQDAASYNVVVLHIEIEKRSHVGGMGGCRAVADGDDDVAR